MSHDPQDIDPSQLTDEELAEAAGGAGCPGEVGGLALDTALGASRLPGGAGTTGPDPAPTAVPAEQ